MRKNVLVIIILFLIISGCSLEKTIEVQPETIDMGEKDSITVYYPSDDSSEVAIMENLCKDFMEKYPEIHVIMEPSAKGIYTENLKIKQALGEIPDVFQIQNPYSFAKADVLGIMPERVGELVKSPVTIGNSVYAVPIYTKTYGIIYNKVLFHNYNLEIPKTYEEFINVCEVFKNNKIAPLALGGSKTDNLSYWFNYFYQIDVVKKKEDWQVQRSGKQVSFTEEPAQTMLKNYVSLLNREYILEDSINMNDNQLISSFVEGKAAMVYAGPWLFSQIIAQDWKATDSYEKDTQTINLIEEDSEELLSDSDFRLGWFFMPDREGNSVAMEITMMNWAISKECAEDNKKKEAATLFLEFFYQKENYRKALQAVNGLPTTKEAVLYPMIGAQQNLMVSYRYAEKSKEYIGNYKTPEAFFTTLCPTLDSLLTGTISLETAAARLDEEWNSLAKEEAE